MLLLILASLFASVFSTNYQHVTIALKQRNTDILEEALFRVSDPASPTYGEYWTQDMIDEVVNPPQETVDKMMNGPLREADCIQKGAAIECYKFDLMSIFSIYKDIDFVEMTGELSDGLSEDVVAPKKMFAGEGYVGREVMVELYNITHNKIVGDGGGVCAVEYQNAAGFSQNDLLAQQQLNGEPKHEIVHIVGVNQGTMIETELDVQMMSQVAEGSDVWFWGGEQWLYSFAVNFLNASDVPDVVSMSWGWSSRQQCSSGLGPCSGNMTSAVYIHRTNFEYIKMGLRGVTLTASSGDAGAPGRTNENCAVGDGTRAVNPIFPGSSPYVTSVGATYLVSTPNYKQWTNWKTPLCLQYGCVNGTKELPCNYNSTGWTTGGGFAIYNETRPAWQEAVVGEYLQSAATRPTNFQTNGRGYPDVSAIGHLCPVVVGGTLMPVDGTSCSSPVFAAMVALLNDYQKSRGKSVLGFLNPVLYKMAEDGVFNDIVDGNNMCTEMQCCSDEFGYQSWKGWDPVTGLGTPNFGLMVEWLEANT